MCVFCDIVAGDAEAHIVFDDAMSVAFLDSRPLFPGHTLLVPRDHHETLVGLPVDLVAPLFDNVRRLTRAVESATGAHGSLVLMNNKVSQSVPHLHVHVVPRRFKDGLRGFLWPRRRYGKGEADAVAESIRAALRAEAT